MVLGDATQQLGPSLLILRRFFFLGVGLGLDMKWAWLAKSFGPTCTFLFLFFIDFSCFYLLNFLGQFIKILERGANYINFKAKIKILFVILLVYFFSKVGGGGGGMPPQPLSSSVIGYTFTIRYYIDIDYYYYICRWHRYKKFVKHLTGLLCIWFHV